MLAGKDYCASLTEKALLLAGMNDWEQCLDTAQRAMDMPVEQGGGQDNIDALKVIAVHAFLQEAQPQDAVSKLEDLEQVVAKIEPNAGHLNAEIGTLFSRICCRQPRALQLCSKLLQRAVRRLDRRRHLIHLHSTGAPSSLHVPNLCTHRHCVGQSKTSGGGDGCTLSTVESATAFMSASTLVLRAASRAASIVCTDLSAAFNAN